MPARRASGGEGDSASPLETRPRGKDGKEKETFGCPYPGCGQSYSRMEYLKRHQRKHQDVRPFQCKDCSKSFARSDVLLRHRRRCHPTPPPADRSSRSPPAMHRGYPGVPISSSRTDAREASPVNGNGRKRPRSSTENGAQDSNTRRRASEDDEFDQRYPERYRQNGMGNGGVYSLGDYYGSSTDDPSNYTPHLLPMFQQATQFQQNPDEYHNQDDPNHLEDASVLLSMAYGGGQGNDEQNTTQGQSEDWSPTQNLNMMMDAEGNNPSAATRDRSQSAQSVDASTQAVPATTDSIGNFLPAMNWLGALKEGTPGEGANTWANNNTPDPSSKSPNPFSFFNIFPTSMLNPSLPGMYAEGENNDETTQAVLTALQHAAMQQVPQTYANPNPERPLLRVEHDDLVVKAGPEISVDSRFHLPADRFAGCYQIPHWALPPLKTLSLMATRTFETVLNHLPFVHEPTFKLRDTAACLAFAICTVGGIQSGAQQRDALLPGYDDSPRDASSPNLDGPVSSDTTWESMYKKNFTANGYDDEDVKHVTRWQSAHRVRDEKTNMLMRSFAMAKGVLMTEYNVALLQALVLYHAPYFLSESETERAHANMFLGTIINVSRQVGIFSAELDHFQVKIQLPESVYTRNEADLLWRRWVQLETRRRTAFLVYHLDTISALESNIPCILSGCEMSHLPLPAPDCLWKARTADEWVKLARNYRPMTLDEAMRRVFFLPTFGAFDELHGKADTKHYNLLNTTELGPFARTIIVLTILRGIMDIGEGKRNHGDWRDLTDLWISCTWLKPTTKMLDSEGKDLGAVSPQSLRDRFKRALERWRQGWDFDPTCPNPATGCSFTPSPADSTSPQAKSSPSSCAEPNKKLFYCEEAIPYYWLAQALLNILQTTPEGRPGWNTFASNPENGLVGISYREMLKSARTFTRMGEGTCSTVPSSCGAASTSIPTARPTTTFGDIKSQLQPEQTMQQPEQTMQQGQSQSPSMESYEYLLGIPGIDVLAN